MGRSLPAQLPHLALNFSVDVERILARPRAAFVAGDDELADLLAQGRVDRRRRQALELCVHVDRRFAAPGAALVCAR